MYQFYQWQEFLNSAEELEIISDFTLALACGQANLLSLMQKLKLREREQRLIGAVERVQTEHFVEMLLPLFLCLPLQSILSHKFLVQFLLQRLESRLMFQA